MRLVAVLIAHLVPVSFTINTSEITAQSAMFSGAHCTSLILCCNPVSAILSRSLGLIQNQMLLNQVTLPASLACSAQADSCSFHLTTQVRLRKQVFAKLEPINLRVQQNDCMIFRTIFAQKIEPIMLSVHLPTVNTDQSFAVQVRSTMLCETSSVDTHPVVSTSISNSMVLHSNANVCEHWSGVRPEKTSLVVATNAITCSADRLRLLQEADPFTLLDYDDETLKQVDYITV